MSDNDIFDRGLEPDAVELNSNDDEMRLDDARRVKILSPGMLVFKRFIRNKLAVVGLVILIFMFLFSFVGPLFSPYGQAQFFTSLGSMVKNYAGAIYNEELRYTVVEGESFAGSARAQFLLSAGKNKDTFSVGDEVYMYEQVNDATYRIMHLFPIAEQLFGKLNPLGDMPIDDKFAEAFDAALESGDPHYEFEGEIYHITQKGKFYQVSFEQNVAVASLNIYDAYNQKDVPVVHNADFMLAVERAIAEDDTKITFGEQVYTIGDDEGQVTVLDSAGEPFAEVSDIIVNPLDQNEFLSVDFKSAIRDGIIDRQEKVVYIDETGKSVEYRIDRINQNYYIKRETPTSLISQYERPSKTHLLGLDNNGMDVMTRLMYGGRVSLLVGFVVVIIEVVLGVIIGGISGYFGGAVDTALMRFVDLFNSIPFYPIVIIFGSVMDTLQVDPMGRIFLLMAILGALGWTGVARVVRGQILSLREQDFMVATEATGIRTSRRIFRHLVPNVMPLLIVQATAGLGGIIISEATLGFLGLGVKYPLASWGSIINVSSDAYVMTNFWFMWIPAGTLILLTVLGFNFVGDGLRDAFDPKMKR